MSRDRLQLVVGILLGSVALHVMMVACSPDSGGGSSAHAQSTPEQTCEQWQVQGFLPTAYKFQTVTGFDSDGTPDEYSLPTVDVFDLPEGWEPFAGEALGATLARRCIKYRQ